MKLLESSQPQSGEIEFLKYKSIFGYIYKNFSIKINERGWVWFGVLLFSIIWLSLICSLILRFIIL